MSNRKPETASAKLVLILAWVGLALLASGLWRRVTPSASAEEALDDEIVIYVEELGVCGGEPVCFETVQEAVDEAQDGERIRIAAGFYAEEVIVASPDANLPLDGGWDDSFSSGGEDKLVISSTEVPGSSTVLGMTIAGGTIRIGHSIPGPTPTVGPTHTPSPKPATPTPSPSASPSPTPSPSPSPSPSPTPPIPPDPADVAPANDPSGPTTIQRSTEFLYTGDDPIQTGVAPNAIDSKRVAVLRGQVFGPDATPLSGVVISVKDHPELGLTVTRNDGMFDLAVNGGSSLVVEYRKTGYIPAHRRAEAPWHEYVWLPDLHMVLYDDDFTAVDLDASAPIQVARGSVESDADGTRRATLLIPKLTDAVMVMPNGSQQPLTDVTIRATEYSVGPNGPSRMQMTLPASSGYTYAVEYSVDEAVAAGAVSVEFTHPDDRPLVHYVENFLGFPVGMSVPVGSYDRERASWVASSNGRVIEILAETAGAAQVDVDGSGQPATPAALDALGIEPDELAKLAELYAPGDELWRVPVDHFTLWDCNWQAIGPAGAVAPSLKAETVAPAAHSTCESNRVAGSIIECESQVLGEEIPITGSPFSLHYTSDRVPGWRDGDIRVPLTGPTTPPSLARIDVEVQIAGQRLRESHTAAPNLSTTIHWDGLDGYGRPVQGSQRALVRVGYAYPGIYNQPAATEAAFAQFSVVPIAGSESRQEITIFSEMNVVLGGYDARAEGIGGWTLSPHNFFDPVRSTLHHGDGSRRSLEMVARQITRVAGGGSNNPPQGGLATDAKLQALRGIDVDAAGNLYIADFGVNLVRRVDATTGLISIAAGSGNDELSGDGGPALQAGLDPSDVAVDAKGTLFLVDRVNDRVRRVDAVTGVITTVAGNGGTLSTGDGGPATSAGLGDPLALALDVNGNIYIAESRHRIRRVDAATGIITTVAGTGSNTFSGDGGLATAAGVPNPVGVAVDEEGNVFIAGQHRVRRIDATTGIIATVAGKASTNNQQYAGDGAIAAGGVIGVVEDVDVDRQGNLYIASDEFNRVLFVDAVTGRLATLAGTGMSGTTGDGGPAAAALVQDPRGVLVDAAGNVLYAEDVGDRVRKISGLRGGQTVSASADGTELYVFNSADRHEATVHALTGATLLDFEFDADGRLSAVVDGESRTTTIERDAQGRPTAIVAPFGQVTTLTVDDNGYLASVTNPENEIVELTHDENGLLESFEDARDNASTMTYDDTGRLETAADAVDGLQTFARTGTSETWDVTRTTALNRVSTYRTQTLASGGRKHTDTLPDETETIRTLQPSGTLSVTHPTGELTSTTELPDSRFGMSAPVAATSTVDPPSALLFTEHDTRTASLTTATNPLSLTELTEIAAVNGKDFERKFVKASKTFTSKTPKSRQSTARIDDLGRVVESGISQLSPVLVSYDPETGGPATITQGSGAQARSISFVYDDNGRLESVTDPAGRATTYEYDLAGRVTTQTLPGDREVHFDYDANGNLTALMPPGRPAHGFSYSARNQLTEYLPPDVTPGIETTTYEYNADAQLVRVLRPDGRDVVLGYDSGGRLMTETRDAGDTTYTYDGDTGQLANIATPEGNELDYTHDGSLLTSTVWSGVVAGTVSRTFDNALRTTALAVNGAAIQFEYDTDGLLTAVTGPGDDLSLARHAQKGGLVTKTTLRDVVDERDFNEFGELTTYTAKYDGAEILKTVFTRDALGRITQKVETIGGIATTYGYTYDGAGRLFEVRRNGALDATYTYDENGNRLTGRGMSTPAAYDDQDRLLQYGDTSFTYTAAGELETKVEGDDITTYTYDELGSLTSAALPDGRNVEYVYDGESRRIAKIIDGQVVQRLLYQDGLKPVAEIDGSGQLTRRFVYAERSNVPAYIIVSGGPTYRILTDHLGSPRLVVNVATGAVLQRLDYDEFGVTTQDTSPSAQPFGFGGGLQDADTGLVLFGRRQYSPAVGRWTSRDPNGFAGLDANVYAYASNDPTNVSDPNGEIGVVGCAGGTAFGGFISLVGGASNLIGTMTARYARPPGCGHERPISGRDVAELIAARVLAGALSGCAIGAPAGFAIPSALWGIYEPSSAAFLSNPQHDVTETATATGEITTTRPPEISRGFPAIRG